MESRWAGDLDDDSFTIYFGDTLDKAGSDPVAKSRVAHRHFQVATNTCPDCRFVDLHNYPRFYKFSTLCPPPIYPNKKKVLRRQVYLKSAIGYKKPSPLPLCFTLCRFACKI